MNYFFRIVLILLCLLLSINVQSQKLPNSFKIGNYIEVFEDGRMLVYMNCVGAIVDKKCADFYRIGRIDSTIINFSGEISDYYITGEVALKAQIENNYLVGEATYYHQNGGIKSTGNYKQSRKHGLWTYYYPNGQKEKVITYSDSYPLINEYYEKNGKQQVTDGNGKYRGDFNPPMACTSFSAWGMVKAGKMDGKWTLYNSAYKKVIGSEYFTEGKFVKGVSANNTKIEKQKIDIDGYLGHENLALIDNHFGCPGDRDIYSVKYQGKGLHQAFYLDLSNSLRELMSSDLNDQWLIVGLKVEDNNNLTTVNIKSSINDEVTEKVMYDLIRSKSGFTSARVAGINVEFDLFFTVLVWDGQIIIPTYYVYNQ